MTDRTPQSHSAQEPLGYWGPEGFLRLLDDYGVAGLVLPPDLVSTTLKAKGTPLQPSYRPLHQTDDPEALGAAGLLDKSGKMVRVTGEERYEPTPLSSDDWAPSQVGGFHMSVAVAPKDNNTGLRKALYALFVKNATSQLDLSYFLPYGGRPPEHANNDIGFGIKQLIGEYNLKTASGPRALADLLREKTNGRVVDIGLDPASEIDPINNQPSAWLGRLIEKHTPLAGVLTHPRSRVQEELYGPMMDSFKRLYQALGQRLEETYHVPEEANKQERDREEQLKRKIPLIQELITEPWFVRRAMRETGSVETEERKNQTEQLIKERPLGTSAGHKAASGRIYDALFKSQTPDDPFAFDLDDIILGTEVDRALLMMGPGANAETSNWLATGEQFEGHFGRSFTTEEPISFDSDQTDVGTGASGRGVISLKTDLGREALTEQELYHWFGYLRPQAFGKAGNQEANRAAALRWADHLYPTIGKYIEEYRHRIERAGQQREQHTNAAHRKTDFTESEVTQEGLIKQLDLSPDEVTFIYGLRVLTERKFAQNAFGQEQTRIWDELTREMSPEQKDRLGNGDTSFLTTEQQALWTQRQLLDPPVALGETSRHQAGSRLDDESASARVQQKMLKWLQEQELLATQAERRGDPTLAQQIRKERAQKYVEFAGSSQQHTSEAGLEGLRATFEATSHTKDDGRQYPSVRLASGTVIHEMGIARRVTSGLLGASRIGATVSRSAFSALTQLALQLHHEEKLAQPPSPGQEKVWPSGKTDSQIDREMAEEYLGVSKPRALEPGLDARGKPILMTPEWPVQKDLIPLGDLVDRATSQQSVMGRWRHHESIDYAREGYNRRFLDLQTHLLHGKNLPEALTSVVGAIPPLPPQTEVPQARTIEHVAKQYLLPLHQHLVTLHQRRDLLARLAAIKKGKERYRQVDPGLIEKIPAEDLLSQFDQALSTQLGIVQERYEERRESVRQEWGKDVWFERAYERPHYDEAGNFLSTEERFKRPRKERLVTRISDFTPNTDYETSSDEFTPEVTARMGRVGPELPYGWSQRGYRGANTVQWLINARETLNTLLMPQIDKQPVQNSLYAPLWYYPASGFLGATTDIYNRRFGDVGSGRGEHRTVALAVDRSLAHLVSSAGDTYDERPAGDNTVLGAQTVHKGTVSVVGEQLPEADGAGTLTELHSSLQRHYRSALLQKRRIRQFYAKQARNEPTAALAKLNDIELALGERQPTQKEFARLAGVYTSLTDQRRTLQHIQKAPQITQEEKDRAVEVARSIGSINRQIQELEPALHLIEPEKLKPNVRKRLTKRREQLLKRQQSAQEQAQVATATQQAEYIKQRRDQVGRIRSSMAQPGYHATVMAPALGALQALWQYQHPLFGSYTDKSGKTWANKFGKSFFGNSQDVMDRILLWAAQPERAQKQVKMGGQTTTIGQLAKSTNPEEQKRLYMMALAGIPNVLAEPLRKTGQYGGTTLLDEAVSEYGFTPTGTLSIDEVEAQDLAMRRLIQEVYGEGRFTEKTVHQAAVALKMPERMVEQLTTKFKVAAKSGDLKTIAGQQELPAHLTPGFGTTTRSKDRAETSLEARHSRAVLARINPKGNFADLALDPEFLALGRPEQGGPRAQEIARDYMGLSFTQYITMLQAAMKAQHEATEDEMDQAPTPGPPSPSTRDVRIPVSRSTQPASPVPQSRPGQQVTGRPKGSYSLNDLQQGPDPEVRRVNTDLLRGIEPRAYGGPIQDQHVYLVGETDGDPRPELYLTQTGKAQLIGVDGPELRTFSEDGEILSHEKTTALLQAGLHRPLPRARGGSVTSEQWAQEPLPPVRMYQDGKPDITYTKGVTSELGWSEPVTNYLRQQPYVPKFLQGLNELDRGMRQRVGGAGFPLPIVSEIGLTPSLVVGAFASPVQLGYARPTVAYNPWMASEFEVKDDQHGWGLARGAVNSYVHELTHLGGEIEHGHSFTNAEGTLWEQIATAFTIPGRSLPEVAAPLQTAFTAHQQELSRDRKFLQRNRPGKGSIEYQYQQQYQPPLFQPWVYKLLHRLVPGRSLGGPIKGVSVAQFLQHKLPFTSRQMNGTHQRAFQQAVQSMALPNVTKFLGNGADALAFQTADDQVLKLQLAGREQPGSPEGILPEHGSRPFDLPLLGSGQGQPFETILSVPDTNLGIRSYTDLVTPHYQLQPLARMGIGKEEVHQFAKDVAGQGYRFWDAGRRQLGYYQDQVKLVDYGAVIHKEYLQAHNLQQSTADSYRGYEGREQGGSVTAGPLDRSQYTQYYHGTKVPFQHVEAEKLSEQNLYGKGYYLTALPRLADTYAGEITEDYEDLLAQAQAAAAVDLRTHLTQDREHGYDRWDQAQKRVASLQSWHPSAKEYKPRPNVRPVLVPHDLKLFDVEKPVENEALERILTEAGKPELHSSYQAQKVFGREAISGHTLWEKLTGWHGLTGANQVLAKAGYEGIRYTGGQLMGERDEEGKTIHHDVIAAFPEALGRLRNGISEQPEDGSIARARGGHVVGTYQGPHGLESLSHRELGGPVEGVGLIRRVMRAFKKKPTGVVAHPAVTQAAYLPDYNEALWNNATLAQALYERTYNRAKDDPTYSAGTGDKAQGWQQVLQGLAVHANPIEAVRQAFDEWMVPGFYRVARPAQELWRQEFDIPWGNGEKAGPQPKYLRTPPEEEKPGRFRGTRKPRQATPADETKEQRRLLQGGRPIPSAARDEEYPQLSREQAEPLRALVAGEDVLVEAGPGAGKTELLRVASRVLRNRKDSTGKPRVGPNDAQFLTFTRRAKENLETRLHQNRPGESHFTYGRNTVRTFASSSMDMMYNLGRIQKGNITLLDLLAGQEGVALHPSLRKMLPSNFTKAPNQGDDAERYGLELGHVLDDVDSHLFWRETVESLGEQGHYDARQAGEWADLFGKFYSEGFSPDSLTNPKQQRGVNEFFQGKTVNGLHVDAGDFQLVHDTAINRAYEQNVSLQPLVNAFPRLIYQAFSAKSKAAGSLVARHMAPQPKKLLAIDEAKDLNRDQLAQVLVYQDAAASQGVAQQGMMVYDRRQDINKFQGSLPMEVIKEALPDAKEFELLGNYRNSRAITYFANRLYHGLLGFPVQQAVDRKTGRERAWDPQDVQMLIPQDVKGQLHAMQKTYEGWRSLGVKPGQMKFLFPTNDQMRQSSKEFTKLGIMHTLPLRGEEVRNRMDLWFEEGERGVPEEERRGWSPEQAKREQKHNAKLSPYQVSFDTIHGSKGDERSHVMLAGLERLWGEDRETVLGVGVTRAMQQLVMTALKDQVPDLLSLVESQKDNFLIVRNALEELQNRHWEFREGSHIPSTAEQLASRHGTPFGTKADSVKHRQSGGPTAGAQPYIVGEAGAELFIPAQDGYVLPHGVLESLKATHREQGGRVQGLLFHNLLNSDLSTDPTLGMQHDERPIHIQNGTINIARNEGIATGNGTTIHVPSSNGTVSSGGGGDGVGNGVGNGSGNGSGNGGGGNNTNRRENNEEPEERGPHRSRLYREINRLDDENQTITRPRNGRAAGGSGRDNGWFDISAVYALREITRGIEEKYNEVTKDAAAYDHQVTRNVAAMQNAGSVGFSDQDVQSAWNTLSKQGKTNPKDLQGVDKYTDPFTRLEALETYQQRINPQATEDNPFLAQYKELGLVYHQNPADLIEEAKAFANNFNINPEELATDKKTGQPIQDTATGKPMSRIAQLEAQLLSKGFSAEEIRQVTGLSGAFMQAAGATPEDILGGAVVARQSGLQPREWGAASRDISGWLVAPSGQQFSMLQSMYGVQMGHYQNQANASLLPYQLEEQQRSQELGRQAFDLQFQRDILAPGGMQRSILEAQWKAQQQELSTFQPRQIEREYAQSGREYAALGRSFEKQARGENIYGLQGAQNTWQYGNQFGTDINRQGYFEYQKAALLAQQTGTALPENVQNTGGASFEARQLFGGVEHQRRMLIYSQAPWMKGAAFEEQMSEVNRQEALSAEALQKQAPLKKAEFENQGADLAAARKGLEESAQALADQRQALLDEQARIKLQADITNKQIALAQAQLQHDVDSLGQAAAALETARDLFEKTRTPTSTELTQFKSTVKEQTGQEPSLTDIITKISRMDTENAVRYLEQGGMGLEGINAALIMADRQKQFEKAGGHGSALPAEMGDDVNVGGLYKATVNSQAGVSLEKHNAQLTKDISIGDMKVGDFGTWMNEHVVQPIVEHIPGGANTIGVGMQIAGTAGSMIENFLLARMISREFAKLAGQEPRGLFPGSGLLAAPFKWAGSGLKLAGSGLKGLGGSLLGRFGAGAAGEAAGAAAEGTAAAGAGEAGVAAAGFALPLAIITAGALGMDWVNKREGLVSDKDPLWKRVGIDALSMVPGGRDIVQSVQSLNQQMKDAGVSISDAGKLFHTTVKNFGDWWTVQSAVWGQYWSDGGQTFFNQVLDLTKTFFPGFAPILETIRLVGDTFFKNGMDVGATFKQITDSLQKGFADFFKDPIGFVKGLFTGVMPTKDGKSALDGTSVYASTVNTPAKDSNEIVRRANEQVGSTEWRKVIDGALIEYCEQFVEDITGAHTGLPTAFAAQQKFMTHPKDANAPKGSVMWFNPSPDAPAGHAAIANGDGTFTGVQGPGGQVTTTKLGDSSYWQGRYAGWGYLPGTEPAGTKNPGFRTNDPNFLKGIAGQEARDQGGPMTPADLAMTLGLDPNFMATKEGRDNARALAGIISDPTVRASLGAYVGDIDHQYANGGWINETVVGLGLHSGTTYSFAEQGPELVVPALKAPTAGVVQEPRAQGKTIQAHFEQSFTFTSDVSPEMMNQVKEAAKTAAYEGMCQALDEKLGQ